MNEMDDIPSALTSKPAFSRKDFLAAMAEHYASTETQGAYILQKRLSEGRIVRIGWNQYALPRKRIYRHVYSSNAVEVAQRIEQEFTDISFQIMELLQLNDFMNHQATHNTIFVSIENDLIDFAFDSLWKAYPGSVLLRPNADQYYRYLQDNQIVVQRLPSEAPKGYAAPWQSRLEKILVDIFTDKLVGEIVPATEKRGIMETAFQDYLVDENTMIRYARRKGAEKKIRQVLDTYGKAAAQ